MSVEQVHGNGECAQSRLATAQPGNDLKAGIPVRAAQVGDEAEWSEAESDFFGDCGDDCKDCKGDVDVEVGDVGCVGGVNRVVAGERVVGGGDTADIVVGNSEFVAALGGAYASVGGDDAEAFGKVTLVKVQLGRVLCDGYLPENFAVELNVSADVADVYQGRLEVVRNSAVVFVRDTTLAIKSGAVTSNDLLVVCAGKSSVLSRGGFRHATQASSWVGDKPTCVGTDMVQLKGVVGESVSVLQKGMTATWWSLLNFVPGWNLFGRQVGSSGDTGRGA